METGKPPAEPSTSRPPKRRGKAADLATLIRDRGWSRIGETELAELTRALAPISESYLRRLLRDTELELDPLVAGVKQGTFEELEASLIALRDAYDAGDAARCRTVRHLVVTAKEHARWASRSPEKRDAKSEMVLWMTTWLENPGLFREWLDLRKAHLSKK